MALIINKLFSSRKKVFNKHQDVCERTFTFSQDQVRVVLFRECDFRGRKLLFDSQSVQKIPLPVSGCKTPIVAAGTPSASPQMGKNEVYVEIVNGYGYQYSRPKGDIVQLGEMVFGSVAMSFRGTSLKIHSFSNPAKLMCTQVFPSPRHAVRGRPSVTSHNFDPFRSNSSVQSFEKSLKLDYSSASSTTSFTEQTSAYSTESDIKTSGSVPLDVPASYESMTSTKLAPSLEGDSGFCGEQSYSSVSVSSGQTSMSLWDSRHDYGSVHGFSCGSLYKRWLRSASTSLDYAACSDGSFSAAVQSAVHSSASADECITRHHRTSKLGLAVIISFSEGQEIDLERFLLEHSALIEAMVSRARSGAESAYTKPGSFASLMYEVFRETSQWLADLITGPAAPTYLWHSLGPRIACDNRVPKASTGSLIETRSESALTDRTKSHLLSGSMLEIDSGVKKQEQNVRRSLFCDKKSARVNPNFTNDASLNAERFVRELCELLEALDTKHTNFFISTLLTAVLTHHLGWVSTVLPPSQTDQDTLSKLQSPCNPLWGQLTDLYGAVGSPTKVAHTIVCGNKADIISKILYTLTYFIRCSIVERKHLYRYSTDEENLEADNIYMKDLRKPDSFKSSKLYEQLSDLKPSKNFTRTSDKFITKTEELEMSTLKNKSNLDEHINEKKDIVSENKSIGLTRTKSCLGSIQPDLDTTVTCDVSSNKHPLLDKVTSLGLSAANVQNNNNEEKLANDYNMFDCYKEIQNLVDIKEASDQIRKVFLPKTTKIRKETSTSNLSKLISEADIPNTESDKENIESNVIFVLGDSDELVGLKKNKTNNNEDKNTENFNIPSCSNERPKDLKIPLTISKTKKVFNCDSSDSSPDISQSCRHSSSSETSPCSECDKNQRDLKITQLKYSLLAGSSKLSTDSNKIVLTRSSVINLESESDLEKSEIRRRDEFNRSQSVPPSDKIQRKCSKNGCKKKYSGVKFDFKQYPQIVTHYMKSKNLEMSQSPFSEKSLKLNRSFSASLYDCSKIDLPSCDCEPHSEETLQTPSNASELEFSSEIEKSEPHRPREKLERKSKSFARETKRSEAVFDHPLQSSIKENNAIFEHEIDTYEEKNCSKESDKMNFIELPMPRIVNKTSNTENLFVGYTNTILRGIGDKYISDMVLQGTLSSPKSWEHILRRDLTLASRKPLLDQPVQEAVAVIANTDTWEVQLVSSQTYIVERGSTGVRVGMSQLVANMLESLLHMWKLRTPPEYCLLHIESRLRELCIRSQALAQLLLSTDFCNMELLTSALQLEVNDVPLLMAVASTHTPQLTHKYGLSFH